MNNRNITLARDYHEATKHSYYSVRSSPHYPDWSNKPHPFKVYLNLPSQPLPHNFPMPKLDALSAISAVEVETTLDNSLDVSRLAGLLFFSAGLTREVKQLAGTYNFRAAPATGALYPIELYVVCTDIPGLGAGVYHFGPRDFVLTKLRTGDWSAELGRSAGGDHFVATAPVTLVFTSIAWRNAWKYQARSYRHWFWDSGVIVANLLATAASIGLRTRVVTGFKDAEVNNLLCVDGRSEATVALVPIGHSESRPLGAAAKTAPSLSHEIMPLSKNEIEYALIHKMHEASSLTTDEEVAEWVSLAEKPSPLRQPVKEGPLYPLDAAHKNVSFPLWEVILRRGSTRKFARKPISLTQLSTLLVNSTQGFRADFVWESAPNIASAYLIANAVDGLPSGSYFYTRGRRSLEQLKNGEFRNVAGYLCLEQSLGADASVVVFLMSDLNQALERYGNRGYRVSQLEAGIIAGKLYLCAYDLGLGATGLTFYDDDTTEFFSPHAEEKSTLMAVALGIPAYKARPGRILLERES